MESTTEFFSKIKSSFFVHDAFVFKFHKLFVNLLLLSLVFRCFSKS